MKRSSSALEYLQFLEEKNIRQKISTEVDIHTHWWCNKSAWPSTSATCPGGVHLTAQHWYCYIILDRLARRSGNWTWYFSFPIDLSRQPHSLMGVQDTPRAQMVRYSIGGSRALSCYVPFQCTQFVRFLKFRQSPCFENIAFPNWLVNFFYHAASVILSAWLKGGWKRQF